MIDRIVLARVTLTLVRYAFNAIATFFLYPYFTISFGDKNAKILKLLIRLHINMLSLSDFDINQSRLAYSSMTFGDHNINILKLLIAHHISFSATTILTLARLALNAITFFHLSTSYASMKFLIEHLAVKILFTKVF